MWEGMESERAHGVLEELKEVKNSQRGTLGWRARQGFLSTLDASRSPHNLCSHLGPVTLCSQPCCLGSPLVCTLSVDA